MSTLRDPSLWFVVLLMATFFWLIVLANLHARRAPDDPDQWHDWPRMLPFKDYDTGRWEFFNTAPTQRKRKTNAAGYEWVYRTRQITPDERDRLLW